MFIEDVPDLHTVVVPIGGGGLISGCAMAIKAVTPTVRIIGVEAAGAPGMTLSVQASRVVTLETIGPMVDGLVVRRVGTYNLEVVKNFADDIVLVEERKIFDTVVWIMERLKLVAEGAAAATVAALLEGLVKVPSGKKLGCVLSGGNLDLSEIKHLQWN
jgi:threonine dehydratase